MPAQSWIPDADWTTIDETIRRLAKLKSALEVEIGRWLLAARRAWPKASSAFGSFGEYVGRHLGYEERKTREKLRVAESLEGLPLVTAELAAGRRSWSAVRELTRVVTPQTERAWLTATDGMTVRKIEDAVRGRKVGEQPSDEKDPLLTPRRMVFDLSPEDFAWIEEAFERVREEIGPGASRAEALKALAERALGGRPELAPAYTTSLTVCVGCERTWQRAGGDLVEVPPEAAACARCDGEVVGFTEVDEGVQPIATHDYEVAPRSSSMVVKTTPLSSGRLRPSFYPLTAQKVRAEDDRPRSSSARTRRARAVLAQRRAEWARQCHLRPFGRTSLRWN